MYYWRWKGRGGGGVVEDTADGVECFLEDVGDIDGGEEVRYSFVIEIVDLKAESWGWKDLFGVRMVVGWVLVGILLWLCIIMWV